MNLGNRINIGFANDIGFVTPLSESNKSNQAIIIYPMKTKYYWFFKAEAIIVEANLFESA